MRDHVINKITEKFKIDKDIFFLLGDLGIFQARFANQFDSYRCINYGIMEQSMLGFASGISKAGAYPIVYSIAPFLVERSFEQLKIDFGYNEAKGLIISAGGSFDYNKLGPTHYCPNDISLIYKANCRKIYLPWNEEDALEATAKILSEKKLGILIVRNKKRKTVGIITDGQIRRFSEKKINFQLLFVKEIMTKNPVFVFKNELAAKALSIMNSKKITSLIVSNKEKTLTTIGVIHVHNILQSNIS